MKSKWCTCNSSLLTKCCWSPRILKRTKQQRDNISINQHVVHPNKQFCLTGKRLKPSSSGNVSTRLGGTSLPQNQELIIFYFCKIPSNISWIVGDEDGIGIPAVCRLIDSQTRKETRINGRFANVVCNTRIEAREQHRYRNWRGHWGGRIYVSSIRRS
jgi:hypothetical protein